MYAIIEDSGTQIKVREGDEVTVDLRETGEGKSVTFDRVLAVGGDGGFKIGQPYLDGASVSADVVDPDFKAGKIDVIKFKRRKGYRRKTGHRQRYTVVKISKISG